MFTRDMEAYDTYNFKCLIEPEGLIRVIVTEKNDNISQVTKE